MAGGLREAIQDREFDKFDLDSNDCTAVRVVGDLNATVSGGITTGGRVSFVTLSAVAWVALPILANRIAMGIQNETGFEIKVKHSNTGGYEGVTIEDGDERFYDFDKTSSAVVYARLEPSAVGASDLTVEELA